MLYLAKLGELTLKGANRALFEKRLKENARTMLHGSKIQVALRSGRLYVSTDDGIGIGKIDDEDASAEIAEKIEIVLSHLIGITGWARAQVCEKSIEAIQRAAYTEALDAKQSGAKTFKIEARRGDKGFPLNSYAIASLAPLLICNENLLAVDVHHPDCTISVEVREKCFVYHNAKKACRGLPVGTGGKGVLLLSGGIDSPVAAYRMFRRGMKLDFLYFHAYPYTSDEAKEKVISLARILSLFGVSCHLNIVHFTDVQMRIKETLALHNADAFSTILLRYCMMKCANLLAQRTGAQCIVSGESLGQVASQTLENMAVTESASDFPLIRPLVGMDKEEIIETAQFIGTYETSILPYADCCSLFAPDHPALRATVAEVTALYTKLDAAPLIQAAFDAREIGAHPCACSFA
ncbi:MAG: tRNA 4-thiouridine(8) synthase ThiI [Treponemataceae bacterium]|nr:MAG: tRNA 4-thiouridine(8) synthase ThiI [Treponemataceae bacterium]